MVVIITIRILNLVYKHLQKIAQSQKLQKIATLVADAKKYEELNKDLNTRLNAANKYKNKLLGKLRKINLKKLSAEEPAVWEKKINNASKRLLESFESISVVPDIKQLRQLATSKTS